MACFHIEASGLDTRITAGRAVIAHIAPHEQAAAYRAGGVNPTAAHLIAMGLRRHIAYLIGLFGWDGAVDAVTLEDAVRAGLVAREQEL